MTLLAALLLIAYAAVFATLGVSVALDELRPPGPPTAEGGALSLALAVASALSLACSLHLLSSSL